MIEVVISTEAINSYGSRVLTGGINLKQYKKNPIVLFMHNRPWRGTMDECLPIGKMQNLRVEEGKLLGEIHFDENDEFAKKIESKFEGGFLNMVSAGLDIVELSDENSLLLPGQTRMTIKKSKLREVSVVDIGSNDEALRLYSNNEIMELSADGGCDIALLKVDDDSINKDEKQMKELLLKLGLPETATEAEALVKLEELNLKAKTADELAIQIAKDKDARVVALVDQAVNDEKITADKKEIFLSIGKNSGIGALEATFGAMQPAVRATDIIGGKNPATEKTADVGAKFADMSWDELDKQEKLVELKEKDFELFKLKYKGEFGVEYKELKTK